jgi:hypothetical protein
MKKWFAPLTVFFAGQLVVLVFTLFLPSVDTSVVSLNATTANVSGYVWGWDWLMANGTVRFMLFMFLEMLSVIAAAMVLLKQKN